MNSFFKIPNSYFELKDLSANEFATLVYLHSIYTKIKSCNGHHYKRVKQATISAKCGLSERTVSRILHKLENKGYLTILKGYRPDRLTGTYTYLLVEVSGSYTMVDRKVFEYGLTPKQLKLYLFINKCIDKKLGYCWNSYKDLATSLNLKRSETISLIKQLVVMKKIRKIRKLRYDNRNEYSDNIYSTKIVKMIKRKLSNLNKIEKRFFLNANRVGANLSVLYINQLFYCENKYKY